MDIRDALRRRLLDDDRPRRHALPDATSDPVLADVIRAASHLGDWFTPETLARFVDRTPLQVLLALQRAADRGLPVEEDGERLRLRLVSTRPVLRNLAAAWDRACVPTESGSEATVPDAETPPDSLADEVEPPASDEPDPALQQAARLAEDARQAFLSGEVDAALTRGAAALSELADREDDPARRLRIQLLSDGAIYLANGNDPLSLQHALSAAGRAVQLLADEDRPELRAAARIALATVASEEGSDEALDLAIDAYTTASRELSDAGRGVDAARLLNELAGVWMRRGDVVRATHLLRSSRQAFEAQVRKDPGAAFELAQTEHLLARLVFHAQARPGAGAALVEAAQNHASDAIRGFAELGRTREEGRAWETLARLQLEGGRPDEALASIRQAAARNRDAHDRVGRSGTAVTHARILAARGRHEEALATLDAALALTLDVGSPAGIDACRSALESMRPGLPDDRGIQHHLAALDRRFAELATLVRAPA